MVSYGWSNAVEYHDNTYIAGTWRPSGGEQWFSVIDPTTDECVATVLENSEEDVDAAVESARAALPLLRSMTIAERGAMLERLATELEKRSEALVGAISPEMGMPVKLCPTYQVDSAIGIIRSTIDALPSVEFATTIGHSETVAEPVGVVGAIVPWNYPLMQTMSKLAPALAAGCPVVLKPSEKAPLDAFLLSEAVDAADLPPGAFAMLLGTGPQVGESLVRHPGIDMISLTGSTRAGRRVAQLAANSIKRVALELGGKSPAVVLEDADLAAAVEHTVRSVMINSGQTCTALTRLLVPFQRMAEVEELVAQAMSTYRVGPAHDPQSDVGPLANENQLHQVSDHLERALLDGARTIWSYPQEDLPGQGYFVPPTAFAVHEPGIAVAQREVFGPVLSVIPYTDEHDAVAIANDTEYGLAATVWSEDLEHALAVARRIDSGTIDLNGAPFNDFAPFGGRKQSGYGRELGVHGILEFTEWKSVQLPKEIVE